MNSRTHIKTKKSAIFLKKNLKINILRTKSITKFGTIVIVQDDIEVLHVKHVI